MATKFGGATSITWIIIVVNPLPPLLAAVTVYVVGGLITVGVPQIVPLLEPNDKPVGKDGDINQLVAGLPFAVGDTGLEITVFIVSANKSGV